MSLKFALQTLFFVTLSSVLIPAQVYSADKAPMEQKMEQKSKDLFDAIVKGNAQGVEKLLAACPEEKKFELLQKQDTNGWNPLHLAAYRGYKEVVEKLLAACPWNKRYTLLTSTNNIGNTPLYLAALKYEKETAKALIQAYPYFQRLGLLQNAEVRKLFTLQEKIELILPAMGVVGGSVIGVAIVGYLGYRYFKKKPLPSTIKTITQSQKTSQIFRAKGTVALQKTL